MQHLVLDSGAKGLRAGPHHETLKLLGVVFHWFLVPVEAGLALWVSLLLVALGAWTIWGTFWVARRAVARTRLASAPLAGHHGAVARVHANRPTA